DKSRYFGESLPNFISTSPEKFWRLISPHSRDCDIFQIGGNLTHDEKIISNAFNKHFKSVFTEDNDVLPNFDANYPPMPDIAISECGILNMLSKL
ncbi:hypothetical protein HPB47_009306, partial [Ixodes persulcatus]